MSDECTCISREEAILSGMNKDQAYEAWAFSPHTCPVHRNEASKTFLPNVGNEPAGDE